MIIEDSKSIKKEIRDLRRFGIAIGIVLTLLGALHLWRGKDYYYYFFIFSASFLFISLFMPPLLKPVYKILMAIALRINWLATRLILSILFYLVITPIGLISKLLSKDFLNQKFDKSQETYWNYRKKKEFKRSEYENQF